MEALISFRKEYAGYTSQAVRTLAKESAAFRQRLDSLHARYFHQHLNVNCTSCWLDAYALLMRYDIEKLTKMANRQFELKAGALLVDVVCGDNALMCTRHNLTDELAIYHLRTNPKCLKMFAKYPDNWEDLVKEEQPMTTDAEVAEVETAPKKREKRKKK